MAATPATDNPAAALRQLVEQLVDSVCAAAELVADPADELTPDADAVQLWNLVAPCLDHVQDAAATSTAILKLVHR